MKTYHVAICCLSLLAGCNNRSFIVVDVESGAPVIATTLNVTLSNAGHIGHASFFNGGTPFSLPQTFSLLLDDNRTGDVTVTVEAVGADGKVESSASSVATIVPKGDVRVTIQLKPRVADMGVDQSPVADFASPLRWTEQAPFTSETLRALWGRDSRHVYVAAEQGDVFNLTDTGWVVSPTGVRSTLTGIWGNADGTTVVAVGLGQTILSSTKGAQWAVNKAGTANFRAIWGLLANDIYAVGYTDNGASAITHFGFDLNGSFSWKQESTSNDALSAVWASGPKDVYAVGDHGAIWHYDGSTWQSQSSGVTVALRGIWGTDANNVYVVGEQGVILHSATGGAYWVPSPSGRTMDLFGIWGSGPADVYAVGDKGTILHSTDGLQWQVSPAITQNALFAIWGSGPRDVYAVGAGGEMLHAE